MKNLFCIALTALVSIALFTACGASGASPVGVWGLENVEGEELTESEKSATLEFKADGSLTRKRGEMEKKGKWKMDEKDGKKVLVIMNEEGEVDEENEIVKLTATEFIIDSKGKKVTLKKK